MAGTGARSGTAGVRRPLGRIAILGGGMAGLSAAWRLSEPGWRDSIESITVYQRGWRLGGKGASSRGAYDRIEEHGLHIWLGSYENAFALLRECYAELDRATTDPDCPIQTWDQAMVPTEHLGMADDAGVGWVVWPGNFSGDQQLPGEPDTTGRELTVVEFLIRAAQLLRDFAESLRAEPALMLSTSPDPLASRAHDWLETVRSAALAAYTAVTQPEPGPPRGGLLGEALDAVRRALDYEHRPEHRRLWLLLSLVTATIRGLVADGLITDPRGFRALNDEEYIDWILRHGAHPDVAQFPLVRGMYDMVFGYVDGDFDRPSFAAGLAVMFTGVALFQYKGAFFWKMTAGMGDVVIAPIYQALRRRGVDFEFFHRLDALHLDANRQSIEAVTMGRQLALADHIAAYEPLERVGGLPVFPSAPPSSQIAPESEIDGLETYFAPTADVETRRLRRGIDFDSVVLAVSLGMLPVVAHELIAESRPWQLLTEKVKTVATQSFQIWLQPAEADLGWHRPGVVTSGYLSPFDTWASMPQTLWAERWPADDTPLTVAYFCGALDAEWPTAADPASYLADCRRRVLDNAVRHLDSNVGLYLPGAVTSAGFDWELLCGVRGQRGTAALQTQYVSVNVDPSDRYVLSVPGSDRHRLRPDESGYDNLVLAGDWTDCGMNAGCIEAAVMSGLQAANALLGRGRYHRIRGFYLP
jgi:uncharacterized protein with NAD-binding domain and iron-sulfur cluster